MPPWRKFINVEPHGIPASSMKKLTISGLILLIMISGTAFCQDRPRVIRILATGKAESTPVLAIWFNAEPSTDATIFPTRTWGAVNPEDIRRYMRIYFPRTFEELLDYEFIFLAQVDITFFTLEQQRWLHDALTNHPRAGVNTRSVMSANSPLNEPWQASILQEVFPNDVDAVIADSRNFQGESGPLVINDDPALPNVMKPFKSQIESIFTGYGGLNTIPRPGSYILSYTKNSKGIGSPVPGQIAHVFYWRWNNSITFTFRDMVYDPFWSPKESSVSNPYFLDIIANMIWFSTGRELPQDPLQVHLYRRLVYDFNIRRSLLISLLDFAELFGANPVRQYEDLDGIDGVVRETVSLYLDRSYDGAYDAMEEAMDMLAELDKDAAKLKDRALLWVYLVEWSVTTAVFLVAGVVLWTLMVRRRLYREVGATKWVR